MKTFLTMIMIMVLALSITSCGNSKVIRVPVEVDKGTPLANMTKDSVYYLMTDVEFETYGFFNKSEYHNDMIEYDWTGGNLFWSIVLSETVIAPVLIIGLDWYEPVGLKPKQPHIITLYKE